jgi:hypothetical protein
VVVRVITLLDGTVVNTDSSNHPWAIPTIDANHTTTTIRMGLLGGERCIVIGRRLAAFVFSQEEHDGPRIDDDAAENERDIFEDLHSIMVSAFHVLSVKRQHFVVSMSLWRREIEDTTPMVRVLLAFVVYSQVDSIALGYLQDSASPARHVSSFYVTFVPCLPVFLELARVSKRVCERRLPPVTPRLVLVDQGQDLMLLLQHAARSIG